VICIEQKKESTHAVNTLELSVVYTTLIRLKLVAFSVCSVRSIYTVLYSAFLHFVEVVHLPIELAGYSSEIDAKRLGGSVVSARTTSGG
jgi:hypothetical protein